MNDCYNPELITVLMEFKYTEHIDPFNPMLLTWPLMNARS
jgi:hypothetical protein